MKYKNIYIYFIKKNDEILGTFTAILQCNISAISSIFGFIFDAPIISKFFRCASVRADL